MKHEIALQLNHAYQKALILVSEQTGIEESNFPCDSPFTLDQCLDSEFSPE